MYYNELKRITVNDNCYFIAEKLSKKEKTNKIDKINYLAR